MREKIMTYDFFADESDKIEFLNYIFLETDLQIFDLYSEISKEICQYKKVDDITRKFDLKNGGKFSNTFHLWCPRFRGSKIIRKVDLNPQYCKGHTFRYATGGWGLIQLYFGGFENNNLSLSHIGHFNQKGALARECTNKDYGKVAAWDWKEIETTSRKLKYHLDKKLAVKRIGTRGILSGAEILQHQGVIFV